MDYLSIEVHYYLRQVFTDVIKCAPGEKSNAYGFGSIGGHVLEVLEASDRKIVVKDNKTEQKYVLDKNNESFTIKDQMIFDYHNDVESMWIKVSKAESVIDSEYLLKHCVYGYEDRERVMNLKFTHFKKGINEIIIKHKELQAKVTTFRRRADLAYSLIQEHKYKFPFILNQKQVDTYKEILFLDFVENEPEKEFRDKYFIGANRAKLIFETYELIKLAPSQEEWTAEDYVRAGYVAEMLKDFATAEQHYKQANFHERDGILKQKMSEVSDSHDSKVKEGQPAFQI
ncbi:MAG: hypothetical protein HUJ61_04730 [Bacilli bacterium]|nr:hypothetical protein [Bacilli bacterium]